MAKELRTTGAAPRPVLWTPNFILVCLYALIIFISFQMLMPTIPVYVKQLGGSDLMVGLVVGAFTVSALAVRPWIGIGLDRYGRKLIWLIGTAVFVLAVLGYIWALTIPLLMLVRVMHGFGWGAVTTSSATAIADIVPLPRRGEGMGYFGLGATLGMVVGPALGFFIINDHSFNTLFLFSAGLAVVALLIAGGTPLPAVRLNSEGVKPALLEPTALLPSLTMLFITTAYGGIVTFIALFGMQHGILNVGFFFTIYAITVMVIRPGCGLLYDRRGPRVVVIPGMLVLATGVFVLAQAASVLGFAVAAVICGLGMGATHPTLQALAVAKCAPNRRGAASATFSSAFDLGIAIGALALGGVVQILGYQAMYNICGAVVLAGLVVYLFTSAPARPRDPAPDQPAA